MPLYTDRNHINELFTEQLDECMSDENSQDETSNKQTKIPTFVCALNTSGKFRKTQ